MGLIGCRGTNMLKVLIEDMNAALLNAVIGSFIVGYITMLYNFKLGFLLMFFLTLFSIIRYMLKRQKSIRNLEAALEGISKGYPVRKLAIYKDSQLSNLHESVNDLSETVSQFRFDVMNQKTSMRSVMNDISAQLIKPIDALHQLKNSGTEILDDKTSHQIEKLKTLVESMSRLVNLETNNEVFCVIDMRIDDVIRSSINEVHSDFQQENLKIVYKPSEAVATFDLEKTREVILNVLSNKLRYATSTIYIELQENPISVYVKIYDDGVAIEGKTRERVFDKFYSENNDSDESLGIGLAIAKEIMNRQNGDLTLEGDNTFVLRFNKK